ncbi:hypothetical protein L1887_10263 [Cichorium endivia]|nr:hypothetical protein L1887_10263 [Cichorium endivia]
MRFVVEGYCWARTAERQASRLRSAYLKAVLRQEVAYFDLNVTSTAEIITSVSSDSLVIQEVISEKVPMFVMYVSLFAGAYVVAFTLLWRLAIVALPFVIILVIPGLIYGKVLMRLSRKIREEYNKAGVVAEQAISSVRTVYSFGGENKSLTEYSDALQGTVKLGLKQGLAKGIAIGSNGVSYAIWSFLCWYGSRMVMYHGARGGTVFAVGALITLGGISLGSGLSDLRYFTDAMAASERIRELIKRIPEIDSDNMEGKVAESGSHDDLIQLENGFYTSLIRLQETKQNDEPYNPCLPGPSLVSSTYDVYKPNNHPSNSVNHCGIDNFSSQPWVILKDGYNTPCGDRGVQLSGGQKQRIAIARAILKNPAILLLDEATSALDSQSEKLVQDALEQMMVGRTSVVVAHRLSTIQSCNTIAVLEKGEVIEQGNHGSLLEKGPTGVYYSLVSLQKSNSIIRMID